MNPLFQHIKSELSTFLGQESDRFEEIFKRMRSPEKEEWKMTLKYINHLLDVNTEVEPNGLNFIHIHFFLPKTVKRSIIVEFISIKFFFRHFNKSNEAFEADYLTSTIDRLKELLSVPLDFLVTDDGWTIKRKRGERKILRKMETLLRESSKI